ncbi:MAG: thioredoxin family protein, partial [Cyclobacteriaceae bacterium]|nr:thioredoxin family protein [Cyclobacteriaceae bacterium]
LRAGRGRVHARPVHIIENYYLTGQADDWTNKETLDKLKKRVAMIKPNFLGNNAPQLVLWDTLGNEINLRDIEAKFTVLYFYDPDCGHCKKSTPILYEAYPELVAKGVEILGICTGTNEKKWKDFIINDDLGWINLADLESKTNVRYFYDIRTTPTVYILDKDKKIVLKKIDTLDVPDVIDMLLKQQEGSK